MGQLIIDFRNKYGETDSAWIVPYPYWVDTRLPGIYAGIPNRDFALWQKDLSELLKVSGPKMIIYNLADHDTENILKQFYPNGTFSHFTSKYQGKDFMVLTVEN
jgi:hypothetical protein